mmetsp:Transcript_17002/g.28246  ORF Transcript_17002/g.28246 Transcript_17002/m.28246 type:complete len:183 (+) Transcript_17002:59-607(+)
MAFARNLKNRQSSSRTAFVAEVVNETMQQFEAACNRAADKGLSRVSYTTTGRYHDELSRENSYAILHQVTEQLKSRVASLGVSSIRVELLQNVFSNPPGYNWSISAGWHNVEENAASPCQEAAAGSSTVQCPICFETSGAVALVPCGHTMCRNCANRVLHAPCPSCRRQVTAVTMGVYMDQD